MSATVHHPRRDIHLVWCARGVCDGVLSVLAAAAAVRWRDVRPQPAFAAEVTSTFAELDVAGALMTVQFAEGESGAGLETVEFFATTNPRYPAASWRDIASGGELARFSLAIQVVAAERWRLPRQAQSGKPTASQAAAGDVSSAGRARGAARSPQPSEGPPLALATTLALS